MRYVWYTSAIDNGWQPRHRLLGPCLSAGSFSGCGSGVISVSTVGTRFHLSAGSLEPHFETALSPSAPCQVNFNCRRTRMQPFGT